MKKLIGGPGVCICDECIDLCNEIIEDGIVEDEFAKEGLVDSVTKGRAYLMRQLDSIPRPVPLETARRLVEAALVLAGDVAATCREVACKATNIDDYEGALAAFSGIPEAHRTTADAINISTCHEFLGDYEGGLATIAAIDLRTASETQRKVLELHHASLQLSAGKVAAEEARALEETADRISALLPTLAIDEAWRAGLVRQAMFVHVNAARLLGELTRAETLLRAHLVDHEQDVHAWALLYDVHNQRGEHDQAQQARERALAHAHPESRTAQRLRDPTRDPEG